MANLSKKLNSSNVADLEEGPNARDLMANIKHRAKAASRGSENAVSPASSSMQHLAELNKLNKNWSYVSDTLDPSNISSHRKVIGPVIVALKKALFSVLRNNLFKPYFDAQEEFNANTVRCLNEITRALTGRSETVNFKRDASLSSQSSCIDYLAFEDRFRGSEDEICKRLSIYPEIFKSVSGPVLEIGAGRGELQGLFKSAGINSYAIDSNSEMAKVCKSKGLNVELGDAAAHLSSLDNRTLGGIIAVQVVEHLMLEYLQELLLLAKQKLRPGGLLVLETINTKSLLALAHNYHRDPTHERPMHPDTLAFLVESAGFCIKDTLKLSVFPDGVCFQMVKVDGNASAELATALTEINHNLLRLNEFMFDYQDYAIVAQA